MHHATTSSFALALAAALWAPSALASQPAAKAPAPQERKPEVLVEARPPPFSEGIFPCMQCHKDQKDKTRRELQFHDEQQSIFDHDAEHRWCLDCHDYENRDMLRLASGALVPFTESYRLCGQCHGDKYRDWRAGVHGKRVGMWNGKKTYYLCVNCHNPHNPRFKALKPEPPPIPPQEQGR